MGRHEIALDHVYRAFLDVPSPICLPYRPGKDSVHGAPGILTSTRGSLNLEMSDDKQNETTETSQAPWLTPLMNRIWNIIDTRGKAMPNVLSMCVIMIDKHLNVIAWEYLCLPAVVEKMKHAHA